MWNSEITVFTTSGLSSKIRNKSSKFVVCWLNEKTRNNFTKFGDFIARAESKNNIPKFNSKRNLETRYKFTKFVLWIIQKQLIKVDSGTNLKFSNNSSKIWKKFITKKSAVQTTITTKICSRDHFFYIKQLS